MELVTTIRSALLRRGFASECHRQILANGTEQRCERIPAVLGSAHTLFGRQSNQVG